MTIALRQSTASQEVPLGYFVDSTDGNTEETGLTIANTDIKIWKTGATTLANKNSGGGTHISNGIYSAVLDATDTNTLGPMVAFVHVAGALSVRLECEVLPAEVYDALYAGSGNGIRADVRTWLGSAPNALVSGRVDGDVGAISTDATAANNLEAALDGTGGVTITAGLTGNVTGNLSGSVGSVTGAVGSVTGAVGSVTGNVGGNVTGSVGSLTTNNDKTGYALSAGGVTAVQSGLATAAALATTDARLDTEIPAIKTVTDNLATALELDGAVYRFTTNALEQSPAGGGGAPTAAAVADAVWDEAIAGHLGAGSTGAKLNGLSGASGSGAITHTITVTENGVPVDGALVWVTTDAAGTTVVASGFTDALGHVTVFLDAGTYYQWAQRGGTNFVNGQSVVVA